MKTEDTESPPANGESYIKHALTFLGSGDSAERLGNELRELVLQVRETGRKGKIVFEVEVRPAGPRGQVSMHDTIKPNFRTQDGDRGGALFFTDERGQLLRKDPNQSEFPFGAGAPKLTAEKNRRKNSVEKWKKKQANLKRLSRRD